MLNFFIFLSIFFLLVPVFIVLLDLVVKFFKPKKTSTQKDMVITLTSSIPTKTLDEVYAEIENKIKKEKNTGKILKAEDVADIINVTCLSDTEPRYIVYWKDQLYYQDDPPKIKNKIDDFKVSLRNQKG